MHQCVRLYQKMGTPFWIFAVGVVSLFISNFDARADEGDEKSLYLGAGLLVLDPGYLTNKSTGATSLTTALYSELALTGRFNLNPQWGISPLINYTPFGHKSPDGGEKTTLLAIGARLYRNLGQFDFKLGPGMLFYTVSGSGGSVSLNNGAGTTSFGIPSTSSTARMLYIDAGFGIDFSFCRLDIDALITGTFSARRATDIVASLSFGLF